MRLIAALLVCALPAAASAGSSYFGEIVGTLPSVRGNAMGDAYAAAEDDPLGFYYNPAHGVTDPAAAAVLQSGYAGGDSAGVIGASLPSVFGLCFGAGLLYYSAGTIDMYTTDSTLRSVDAEQDVIEQLNLSRALTRRVTAGVNVKMVQMSLFGEKRGTAVLGDAGVLARYGFANLGAAVCNVGQGMKLGSEKEKFPYSWRAGAYKEFGLYESRVALALDRAGDADGGGSWRAGAELKLRGGLALRGGFALASPASGGNTAHLGFGLAVGNMLLDYAMVPYRYVGATHRFGLQYRFQ